MAGESFRFIHASDFHLERPLGDLDILPSHLREPLATAPFKAASAVFEAAMVENIDFLVLSGDLLNPIAAGPRGMSLLLNHFQQLNQRKTPVFWAASVADDPARWPEAVPFPANVTLFPKNRAQSVPVQRAGRTICHVVGRSGEGRQELHVPSFRVDPTDEFTVVVGAGQTAAESLAEGRFDYWALGGDHQRREITNPPPAGGLVGAYCGSPQARSLDETGPHGYTLVDVDSQRTVRAHAVDCDLIRYCRVSVDATGALAVGNLKAIFSERVARLLHEHGSRHLIIHWDISVSAETMHLVADPQEWLQWLRRDYGHGSPAAWTSRLTIHPPKKYPKDWTEEDTILGDFLRAGERHAKQGAKDLHLAPFTEEHSGLSRSLATLLADVTAADRAVLLQEATRLGVGYLRGGMAGQGGKQGGLS